MGKTGLTDIVSGLPTNKGGDTLVNLYFNLLIFVPGNFPQCQNYKTTQWLDQQMECMPPGYHMRC